MPKQKIYTVVDSDMLHKKIAIVIDLRDADHYKKSLLSIRKHLISTFNKSDDMSYRGWVNTHGPIIDELLEELGHRFRSGNGRERS